MFTMSVLDSNEYRHFCNHELSATIDNDGGICFLNLIDCYEYEGMIFPDENLLPILSRSAACTEHNQEYGAGIQLYSALKNGRTVPHHPSEQRFTLSYLEGEDHEQAYKFLMESTRLLWECGCSAEGRDSLLLHLHKGFWFDGSVRTHKDQHRGEGSTQSGDHCREAGVELDVKMPLLNGVVKVQWREEAFDETRQVLLVRGVAEYPYGTERYVIAIGADAPVVAEEARALTVLRMPWEQRETIHVGLAIGRTEEEAIASLRDGVQHFSECRAAHLEAVEACEQKASCVCVPSIPFAEQFGKAAAARLDALMVGPTDEGRIGVRASAGKYGYFSIWDTIYPIRDFLWNGRYEDAARFLHYLFHLPAMENTPIGALHLIAEWNEAMAFLPPSLQEDVYPEMLRMFRFACRLTEPKYGLLLCKGNTGVDKPEQMGLSGLFLSPDVNGLWYSVCRIVRNEAIRHSDEETAALAGDLAERVEQGFANVFFAEAPGYLRAAANRDLTPAAVEVYHNSLTLGYDYPYGMYLMRDIASALANYQATALYHPFGHRAVAIDSDMPSGWWKYVHMNQHNGHEMKLQRAADNVAEVHRVMGEVMRRSDRWKNAEETTNFSRFSIHPDQVCDWQTFGATGEMEALRAGVAGVLRHRGGLRYLPARDSGTVRVEGVPMGDSRISVVASGKGSFATLKCAGKPIKGTLQLPADVVCSDGDTLQICRTDKRPSYPVLLSATDLSVRQVSACRRELSFVCGDTAHTPIEWYAETSPRVFLGDEEIAVTWNEATGVAVADRLWKAGDVVRVVVG